MIMTTILFKRIADAKTKSTVPVLDFRKLFNNEAAAPSAQAAPSISSSNYTSTSTSRPFGEQHNHDVDSAHAPVSPRSVSAAVQTTRSQELLESLPPLRPIKLEEPLKFRGQFATLRRVENFVSGPNAKLLENAHAKRWFFGDNVTTNNVPLFNTDDHYNSLTYPVLVLPDAHASSVEEAQILRDQDESGIFAQTNHALSQLKAETSARFQENNIKLLLLLDTESSVRFKAEDAKQNAKTVLTQLAGCATTRDSITRQMELEGDAFVTGMKDLIDTDESNAVLKNYLQAYKRWKRCEDKIVNLIDVIAKDPKTEHQVIAENHLTLRQNPAYRRFIRAQLYVIQGHYYLPVMAQHLAQIMTQALQIKPLDFKGPKAKDQDKAARTAQKIELGLALATIRGIASALNTYHPTQTDTRDREAVHHTHEQTLLDAITHVYLDKTLLKADETKELRLNVLRTLADLTDKCHTFNTTFRTIMNATLHLMTSIKGSQATTLFSKAHSSSKEVKNRQAETLALTLSILRRLNQTEATQQMVTNLVPFLNGLFETFLNVPETQIKTLHFREDLVAIVQNLATLGTKTNNPDVIASIKEWANSLNMTLAPKLLTKDKSGLRLQLNFCQNLAVVQEDA